jgi:predicted secreted protein
VIANKGRRETTTAKKSREVRRRTDFNFYQRYKLNKLRTGKPQLGVVWSDCSQLVIQSVAMATRRRLAAPVAAHRNINVMIRIFSEESTADSSFEEVYHKISAGFLTIVA